MGLYDELRTQEVHVRCPQCGGQFDYLQTKSLPDPGLDQYRFGEEISVRTRDGLATLVIDDGRILGGAYCESCGASSEWYAVIENKRWVRTELAEWRPSARATAVGDKA